MIDINEIYKDILPAIKDDTESEWEPACEKSSFFFHHPPLGFRNSCFILVQHSCIFKNF
jgi:hypothetical protein